MNDLALPLTPDWNIPFRPFGPERFSISICVASEHDDQATRPPSSFFSPRATIINASSGKGR
jgi:hypothetical protein